MAATPIVCGKISVDLTSSPINRDWIVDGNPTARNAQLAQSQDRKSCTLIWDCTPGQFVWHYDIDETIHILEGSIVLDDGVAPPRRLGPGDVVFFPAGAVVHWTVETHVRKLAFFPAPDAEIVRDPGSRGSQSQDGASSARRERACGACAGRRAGARDVAEPRRTLRPGQAGGVTFRVLARRAASAFWTPRHESLSAII